ncbi:GNAT family N-acetyltransferase [Duganella callida]|uniref:GNAT family N-acetyltransferase n=1 Tax=Duganella callida TaxID=2561932 RepID=A0A4Y9SC85_9BURK|nr:GNAT family N-acetyltransferase [Duganella callida]TFW17278.1 GNAT family N-acetyltransferase [Duganella callida]
MANDFALMFERLQLPRDLPRVHAAVAPLAPLLQALLGEAACNEDGQLSVMVGSRAGQAVLLAPCRDQALELPLRLGEKVLWRQSLPAMRLTGGAQDGVGSAADALDLLARLRVAMPGRALVLSDVEVDSPLYQAVLRAREAGYVLTRNAPDTHLYHRFVDSYDAFFQQRSSKQRTQLRKKEKVFVERYGREYAFREYRQPGQVAEFLRAARAINRKTYQFRMFGERIDDDEASIAAGRRAAAAGRFRSFILWHRDQPLCFIVGHQRIDGTFEHRCTGFDPEHRDAAPGINCNILLLQRLYEEDRPRVLDFGGGDADYKRLFANESRLTADPVLLPRRWRFLLARSLYERSAWANESAVRVLKRLGLQQALKRWLRGTPP